jgi:hypothetical protein
MGKVADKAIEELRRSTERRSPIAIYLEETREDFYRRHEQELREIIPGFDPAAEVRRRRREDPLKRRPVARRRARPAEIPEDFSPRD